MLSEMALSDWKTLCVFEMMCGRIFLICLQRLLTPICIGHYKEQWDGTHRLFPGFLL